MPPLSPNLPFPLLLPLPLPFPPLLPPGLGPSFPTTFLPLTSPASATSPCRCPELVASQCIALPYSSSLARTPPSLRIPLPALLFPAEVSTNSHPLASGDASLWSATKTCSGTHLGPDLCRGSWPMSPPQKSEPPVALPWRTSPKTWY